jgi:hypothetical protein
MAESRNQELSGTGLCCRIKRPPGPRSLKHFYERTSFVFFVDDHAAQHYPFADIAVWIALQFCNVICGLSGPSLPRKERAHPEATIPVKTKGL